MRGVTGLRDLHGFFHLRNTKQEPGEFSHFFTALRVQQSGGKLLYLQYNYTESGISY